jgi:hypothetical protein
MSETLIFKNLNDNDYWLYLNIDPDYKPLSRNFFKGEHFGNKALIHENITIVQEIGTI